MPKRSDLGKHDEAISEDQKARDLARTLNLPRVDMAAACDLFKRHAEFSGATSLLDGRLTKERFAGVLREITGRKNWEDLSPALTHIKFGRADQNSGGGIDFSDFAIWFSSRSFYEDFNLDAGQQSLRKLARKYDMPYSDVEQYKKSFDHFDTDHSGAIQKAEFQRLLCKLSKVPESIGIAPARVQELWSGADMDKTGEIDFREFLVFYRKYFDTRGDGGAGFEDYYRSVRKVHAPVHS
jgi:Ca2+-binding EF-hand superfamily protein